MENMKLVVFSATFTILFGAVSFADDMKDWYGADPLRVKDNNDHVKTEVKSDNLDDSSSGEIEDNNKAPDNNFMDGLYKPNESQKVTISVHPEEKKVAMPDNTITEPYPMPKKKSKFQKIFSKGSFKNIIKRRKFKK